MQLRAVGVDGTRGGWVAVVVVGDEIADVWRVADLATVADRVGAVPFGIDIPVGLLDRARRSADVAARAQLAHTASSVFPAPCRSVVDAFRAGAVRDHDGANALSRRVIGVGLSRQTWNLVDKIAEADALVERGVELREVHPELAFHQRAVRPLASKRTWNGVMARLAILRALGLELPDHVEGGDRLAPDDVLDAAIVAWTAAGAHHRAELRSNPDPPREWDRGRPIAIWTRP
ncbi:MAG TPA: DUF429 domain-containing protein [Euzebyales bacterium]|nr:DUF429 domain-containing protein [Euzebyales bacterium]